MNRPLSCGLLCLGLLATALVGPAHAGPDGDRPHRFATFTLFDPLTTTGDRSSTSNFRLALVESHLHSVRGLDLVGVASTLSGDVAGLQLVGIYSHVGGDARAIALTGVASHVVGDSRGLRAAGVANVTRGSGSGLQLAGVLNFSAGEFTGLQWSAGVNMNDAAGQGWQLSSVANVSNGHYAGLQTAAFYNFCNHDLHGVQLAALNWSRSVQGVQVGLLNLADEAHGLQLGVANVVQQQDGVPVGLVNASRNSRANWMIWGSNYVGIETGVRTSVRGWYSILSVGGVYAQDTDLRVLSFGWDYGYRFLGSGPWSLSVDAGFMHLIPEKNDTLDDRLRPAVQGRAFVERAVSPQLSIHAGAGATLEWAAYDANSGTDLDPLFFAGVSLFGGQR